MWRSGASTTRTSSPSATDGTYDGYQIKTSQPGERGLEDERRGHGQEHRSVRGPRRRVRGSHRQPVLRLEYRVSTTAPTTIRNEKRRRRRPRAFLDHVRSCASHSSDIAAPYVATFLEFQGECGCQPDELFVVLRRMDLIIGPSRDSFHAVVAHEHLGRLPELLLRWNPPVWTSSART